VIFLSLTSLSPLVLSPSLFAGSPVAQQVRYTIMAQVGFNLRLLIGAMVMGLIALVSAQGATTASSAAASAATDMVQVLPSDGDWVYTGCYNETTGVADSGGVRALAGGSMVCDLTS